jgi:cytoplasmic iron level regulating protein YaaA (DUF328/UPF0246 family)
VLLILPPSETKRDGGDDGSRLELESLGFTSLTEARATAAAALVALAASVEHSTRALKLGKTQAFEIERNRQLLSSPVMPAIDRYTGVIYDALDAATLTPAARAFAADHLVIGSALFGLLRADDRIPAYRLSHDSRLPGIGLGKLWRAGVEAELGQRHELILDLRSEAYAALGRGPQDSFYIRVLSEGPDGRRVALSHFNKHAKGAFTRAVLESGAVHADADALIAWARKNQINLDYGALGELDLVV